MRVASSQYYEASALDIALRVVQPGSPASNVPSERPVVEVSIKSLDDPTLPAVTLGTVSLSHEQEVDLTPLGLPAQLRLPLDRRTTLTRLNGDPLSFEQALEQTADPAGNDYPLAPVITAWSGLHSSHVTLEVIDAGHTIGGADLGSTDEGPARVRVTLDPLYQAGSVSHEVNLTSENGEYTAELDLTSQAGTLSGLSFRFPSARLTSGDASITASSLSGAYQRVPRLYADRFVNEEAREYTLTFTSTGIMSNQIGDGGPSAQVDVYERDALGQRVLVQSYDIPEINTDQNIYLGEGDERDGAYIRFPRGPSLSTSSNSRNFGGSVSFSSYLYNLSVQKVSIFEITKAGKAGGADAAEYRYYYQDDPSVTISSGKLHQQLVLDDNTLLRAEVRRSYRATTPGMSNNLIYIRDYGYNLDQRASFTSTIEPVAPTPNADPELKLVTRWRYEDGTEDTFLTPLVYDQYRDIGNGMRLYFYGSRIRAEGDFQEGMSWSGEITGFNEFEVGDRVTSTIVPNLVNAGDSYDITFNPLDLEVGAKWELNALSSDWKPGDVYHAALGSGFEPTAHTLTTDLTYPLDEPNADQTTLGALKITGAGRFEVGDQIRVHTRGFVGEVVTEGTYTHPLPTEYVLKVTKGGEIGDAELTWARADGLTNTEQGGEGQLSGLSLDTPVYLEEGLSVAFKDLGEGIYLAEGDEIVIPVGRNLSYTFGGQLSLSARDQIQMSYSDNVVDQQLGRLLFMGTEEQALTPHYTGLSLERALLAPDQESSLASASVSSVTGSERAIESVDVAIAQVLKARSEVGAMSARLERRAASLEEQVVGLSQVQERVSGVDVGEELIKSTADQIRLMSAPQLNRVALVEARRVLDLISQGER